MFNSAFEYNLISMTNNIEKKVLQMGMFFFAQSRTEQTPELLR
jgi:hypothetical protein